MYNKSVYRYVVNTEKSSYRICQAHYPSNLLQNTEEKETAVGNGKAVLNANLATETIACVCLCIAVGVCDQCIPSMRFQKKLFTMHGEVHNDVVWLDSDNDSY